MAVHTGGEGGDHPAPLLPDIAYICKRGSVESHSLAGACVVYAPLDGRAEYIKIKYSE